MTTPADCYGCEREARFGALPPRERIAFDEHRRVTHAIGTALPGWLVLIPRRHVTEIAALTDAKAAGLGTTGGGPSRNSGRARGLRRCSLKV